jgi:hypothetical protein
VLWQLLLQALMAQGHGVGMGRQAGDALEQAMKVITD